MRFTKFVCGLVEIWFCGKKKILLRHSYDIPSCNIEFPGNEYPFIFFLRRCILLSWDLKLFSRSIKNIYLCFRLQFLDTCLSSTFLISTFISVTLIILSFLLLFILLLTTLPWLLTSFNKFILVKNVHLMLKVLINKVKRSWLFLSYIQMFN